MFDIRAEVNDKGIVLYINFATEKPALDALLKELGGVRSRPAPDRISVGYGNGLTKNVAKTILKRLEVPLTET